MSRSRGAIQFPRFTHGGGGRKFVGLLAAVAVLWWIIDDPVGAANDVGALVDSIGTFIRALRA